MHPVFAQAILKYGWSNFEHKIIFSGLTKQEADLIEIDLIYYYKKIGKSYNCANGGDGGNGVNELKICQYDLKTGTFIKMWDSIVIVENTLGIKNIGACCRKARGRKTAGGYLWRFYSDGIEQLSEKDALCKQSRAVIQYDLTGNELMRWNKIQDATNFVGISKKCIQECCVHRQHSGGYIWKYVDENFKRKTNTNLKASGAKSVGKYDVDGKLIKTYFSANEAARQTGIRSSTITLCCRTGRFSKKFKCFWKWL